MGRELKPPKNVKKKPEKSIKEKRELKRQKKDGATL